MKQIISVFSGKAYRVIEPDGSEWFAAIDDQDKTKWDLVESYLASHPEALIPEPTPPEPTPEERSAQARAALQAQLDELDRRTIRPLRAGEADKVAALDAEAKGLRAKLAAVK